jgi:hypothetical protein
MPHASHSPWIIQPNYIQIMKLFIMQFAPASCQVDLVFEVLLKVFPELSESFVSWIMNSSP